MSQVVDLILFYALSISVGCILDFLKVVRLVFWSGLVGPGTNDFYPLQRAKFTGGIFLL